MIEIAHVKEHYEFYQQGKFIESCDVAEYTETLKRLRREEQNED